MQLKEKGLIDTLALKHYVAAISVGIFNGQCLLDLDYSEDSKADMDMNVVMVSNGGFVEVQGTAEGKTYSKDEMDKLLDIAQKGINELFAMQKDALNGLEI